MNIEDERVRVLVLTGYYEPAFRGGGPIQTLRALLRDRPEWVDASVICSNSDLGDVAFLVDAPDTWIDRDEISVRYVSRGWRSLISALNSARRDLGPSIVYLNSFFSIRYTLMPQLWRLTGFGRRAGFVLAPRGELHKGALAIKSPKKQMLITVYRILSLHRRVLWHASTDEEAGDIRRVFGEFVSVVVRENETSLPSSAHIRSGRELGICRLTFASRAVRKKGLLILLEALRRVTSPVAVEIIGGFEDPSYESQCRDAAARLPSHVSIEFRGPLPREEVLGSLRRADGMVFPTEGENFGHVIAEALSEACPVISSRNTPWTDRLTSGGGVVVEPNSPDAWLKALDAYIEIGPDGWQASSDSAAAAFRRWRNEDKGPHVFELARDHFLGPQHG